MRHFSGSQKAFLKFSRRVEARWKNLENNECDKFELFIKFQSACKNVFFFHFQLFKNDGFSVCKLRKKN